MSYRIPENLDPEMRQVFPFRLFLNDKYLTEGIAARSELDELTSVSGCDSINLDNATQVPDMPGQILQIESDSVKKREKALLHLLENIAKLERQYTQSSEIECMTFVPEGLVCLCIGHKGRLVSRIKDETNIELTVNQRVAKMSLRSVYCKGKPEDVSRAQAIMYSTLEEQAYLIKDWAHVKTEQISREDVKLTAKFIVDTEACGFIIGRQGNFTKYLEHRLNIYMRCDKDDNNRILKPY